VRDFDFPEARILEIGCGMMQYQPYFLGKYQGLDIPTSKYIEKTPHIVGSAENIPLEAGSQDFVFAVASLFWMENPLRVLSECHRVLKKGGTMLIFDYQKWVGERLKRKDAVWNRHAWDFTDLSELLVSAGFSRSQICKISEIRYPSLFWNDLIRVKPNWKASLKRILGRSDWLIVRATK